MARWHLLVRRLAAMAAVVLAVAPQDGTAQAVAPTGIAPALARRIDRAVRQVLAEERAPSASIAIVRDGHVAYVAAYGDASLSPRIAATPDTRYQLASLSKTLTAHALLLLEQDGRLSLDDPVSGWYPDVSDGGRATVRQLLQHTAGFPDHYPQTYPAGPRTRPTTPDAIIDEWGRHPLLFEPGSRFRYSNLNYVLAGRIAERAAGGPLFAFLQARVFTPLGMAATLDLDALTPQTPRIATGYVRAALGPLEPAPAEGAGWSFGAGQVVTTAGDLARWDAAFLGHQLLAPAQAQEQITPPTLADGGTSPYALGLFVSKRGGRTLLYHVGQGLGFLAVNRLYPAEGIAIVVLTNDSSSPAFSRIADRLAYLVVPPTPTDAQARALFRDIQAGRLDRAQASADFNAYFDAKRARTFAQTLGPLGEPDSFDLRSQDEADGLTTRTYEVQVSGRKLRVVLQVLADGRVESFDVQAG
ncbi:MAG: serine hydrolase [Azospirillaceae bacterium]|nr:serine hydrolase [Azospirillaceae bacterium]